MVGYLFKWLKSFLNLIAKTTFFNKTNCTKTFEDIETKNSRSK